MNNPSNKLKVCFFGSYVRDSYGIPSGNGGTLIKKILEKQNIEVIECHETIDKKSSFISSYLKLLSKHRKLEYDIMLIPWRGILTFPLAKFIHRKPIIYFPAFSIYDTLVNDRKKIKKNSLKARIVHFVDKQSCKWSDKVILESSEEINYFVNEFGLPKKKFDQLSFAADETIFVPQIQKTQEKEFIVLFFGSFIPLHGLESIVESAKILKSHEDILFKICGDGQTKKEIEKITQESQLKNVQLLGLVSKDSLIDNIKNSDICLGLFGSTNKARKVVTNKVFQILASQKPLITMDSPAAREVFLENGKNCLLVPASDPKKLADAILFLKNNPQERQTIAKYGYQTYKEHLSMSQVGKKLVSYIHELL